jgi:AcrR family transcriptional regulator
MIDKDDPRSRLLDAAGEAFAEKGFEGATVRDIIARAGANIAAVNYYFRDKERLYIEAVKHAACMPIHLPAFPNWGPDTPATEKLRDFIRMRVTQMMKSDRPAWHSQLMMRELSRPTAACTEFVHDYVRPVFNLLCQILRELLPPHTPSWKVYMTVFSIIGQILYYVQCRPVVNLLVTEEELAHFDGDAVAEHIASFTLAALGNTPSSEASPKRPTASTKRG